LSETTLDNSRSSFIKALLIFATSMLTNFPSASGESPADKKVFYEQQFSRAVRDGPLVNTTPYQYIYGSIAISAASQKEDRLDKVSVRKAMDYLDQGAEAWNGVAKCVTCHTNGSYMAYRPALAEKLGKPSEKVRQFFKATLQQQLASPKKDLRRELGPTQVIYVANGLAQWDAHVTHRLSPQTRQALELMFEIQGENGAWAAPASCWPPFESDSYQAATMAAQAVSAAPGWAAGLRDQRLVSGLERLKSFLRTESPPHDYARVFLLWAASKMPDLLTSQQRQELIKLLWKHQRPDGGWSIRTFAAPEEWGSGNRAEKLRAERDFQNPPSDGHQTGLVITVLREAGVPSDDPRIRRGIQWLLTNQRVSGRWWTRSLNTDEWHFITYSGTCFALLALSSCDAF
jgi:squalene-hopene/tetraprenyl-beta-curcumene cyclase